MEVTSAMRRVCRTCLPYIPYVVAALAIMGPLLLPGYIFALDMVFTPVMPPPVSVTSAYLFQLLMHYASLAVPAMLLQKVLLLAIFAGAGIGAHRMLLALVPRDMGAAQQYALYTGGLLYVFNPFVYSRLMAGQYLVLAGYALLPFFVRTCVRLVRNPGWLTATMTALLLSCIAVLSIHTTGMAILLLLCITGVAAYGRRHTPVALKRLACYSSAAIGGFLLLSSYWLIALLHGGTQASLIGAFSVADRTAFATSHEGLGLAGNIAGLQGFWGDAQQLYMVPYDVFSWWFVPIMLMWLLVGSGILYGLRIKQLRVITVSAIVVAAVAGLLAAGTVLNAWLAAYIPGFAGYREPQKFVALIALAYVWLAYVGAVGILQYIQRRTGLRQYAPVIMSALLVLPIATAPLLPWGGNGHLHARAYPADWYVVRQILSSDTSQQTLFLPWHLYMRFGFTGVVSANPAPRFFGRSVIASTDPEFQGANGYGDTARTRDISRMLDAAGARTDFATQLHRRGIGYVMLAHDADYAQYGYIASQPGMQAVFTGDSLTLYKVEGR